MYIYVTNKTKWTTIKKLEKLIMVFYKKYVYLLIYAQNIYERFPRKLTLVASHVRNRKDEDKNRNLVWLFLYDFDLGATQIYSPIIKALILIAFGHHCQRALLYSCGSLFPVWAPKVSPAPLVFTQWTSEVAQSWSTLCDPMDYSLPGSSTHGIFQPLCNLLPLCNQESWVRNIT